MTAPQRLCGRAIGVFIWKELFIMTAYEFPILADLSMFSTEVGAILKNLNDILSSHGVPERISVTGEIGVMRLSAERDLQPGEIALVKELLGEQIRQRLPEFALSVGEPRRQTGNPSSQSTATE